MSQPKTIVQNIRFSETLKALGERIYLMLAIALMVFAAGCSTIMRNPYHGFTYTVPVKSEVKLLDYEYGTPRGVMTEADAEAVKTERVSWQGDVFGRFKVGNYLYVKWRVKETGVVLSRKIDLTNVLPINMDGKEIHFQFKGKDLVVYLISEGNAQPPNCPARNYEHRQCVLIYTTEQFKK